MGIPEAYTNTVLYASYQKLTSLLSGPIYNGYYCLFYSILYWGLLSVQVR